MSLSVTHGSIARMAGAWRASGGVSEREELLDGRLQVALDGETADGLAVSLTLVWLIGREGGAPLDEGYLTVADGAGELNASLESGETGSGDDSGATAVRARFAVDDAEGALAPLGSPVECELEVGAESWSGELRLGIP